MIRAPLPFDRATRREREVNWGDKTKITGGEKKTLAWVSVAECRPMIVYATATLRGGAAAAGVAFVVNVEWGHGGASIDHDYEVVHRLRVPVAASMVRVSGRLLDDGGKAPPATVSGEIAVFIAPGNDGETVRNTRWVHQDGYEDTIVADPARVVRVEGYNAGAVDTWLMVFDGVGNNGDFPTMARPVRAGRSFVMRRFDTQAFRTSVTWRASSTPITLTKDPSALMRVDTELLL
jgi:hypothetical protein